MSRWFPTSEGTDVNNSFAASPPFDLGTSSGVCAQLPDTCITSSERFSGDLGQGASAILAMGKLLEYPARHCLYFDNFFTSHYLMCTLTDKKLCATGTMRANRDGHPPLKTGKALPKGKETAKQFYITAFSCLSI